jgi:murein DD-endopeptidase MepM/ murein hydrolase activator NlpD
MKTGPVLAIAALPLAIVTGLLAIVFLTASSANCGGAASHINLESVPAGPIAGYSGEQLKVAATIANAAADQGLPAPAQAIGVMVAITDSQLSEPVTSSFFTQLSHVTDWQTLNPSVAANSVTGSDDPYKYSAAYKPAQDVLQGLLGSARATSSCGVGAPGAVAASGWANPAVGRIGDHYGYRTDPATHKYALHAGQDIAAKCGTPIYAAHAGTVTHAGPGGGYGNLITIDHGGLVSTAYGHMYPQGIFVHAGEQVVAGQNIAQVGNTGQSTGCHLHFEVRIAGTAIDPLPYMTEAGVRLGG